jgi:outer membrane receptor for ferrienterochelin and colicin
MHRPRARLVPAFVFAMAAMAATALLGVSAARADDMADEADLQFRIGADRYTVGDYQGALEHFLASNRLVPNRNVVFNVARTYEKLERYPESFRYYTAALEGEADAAARARINVALEQIRPHVAVLSVETEPPGATIYVDRRDLGSRGESPRALGLPAGRYRIIAELPGFYPAETVVEQAAAGQATSVRLALKAVLGRVRIEGAARGARVRVDDPRELPRCVIPCVLELPPGAHVLHVSLEGHRTSEVPVDILARAEIVAAPTLASVTGTALITTDEPGALVAVDGSPSGFTPTILALPVGEHQVALSLRGFRPVARTVTVLADRQVRIEEALAHAEEVEAASRVVEPVEDAPSSVTIVPREELTAFGYPTIAEAVRGVRGIYLWNDRAYQSLGVRGLGRLGGYGNRELVLLDGQPTNDDWVGSSYVGFDGRTDLADIERIEVVRGPGSVLYGTNAFSGVVNLVTRYRDEKPGVEAGISAVDASVTRGRVRAQASLGKNAGVWTSIAGARGSGRDFFFPASDTGSGEAGASRNADAFAAATVEGRVWWKWLTAQWFLHSHDKQLPTGAFETLLGDPRTHQQDTRAFVEARAEPVLSRQVQLLSRVHWNVYRFRGDYSRALTDGGLERDTFDGQWVGAEQRVVVTPSEQLRLTLGGEGQLHYRVDTSARDNTRAYLDDTGDAGRPYRVGAVYALADADPSDRVRLSGGVRLDAYSTFGSSLNPRAAVILRPYSAGNLKILGGKAFRAPSTYELHYNDGGITQVPSPDLRPESIYSFEVEHSHRFSPTVTGLAAVYGNYVTNLVQARGGGVQSDPLHYVNAAFPLLLAGVEIGVRREWRQGFMLQASYEYQHATYLASTSAADFLALRKDSAMRNVENSPEHLATFKAAAPILARGLTAATRITFEGPRYDRYESVGEPAQGRTASTVIWDLVLSGHEDRWGFRYSLGAYNVADLRYALPVSNEFSQRSILQNGRTFLASMDVAF